MDKEESCGYAGWVDSVCTKWPSYAAKELECLI
jgi:hypothetical protein